MKNILKLIILTLLFSCSNEDNVDENEILITGITPKKIRIGDTLIIRGKNVNKISSFDFKTVDDTWNISPVERGLDEIKVVVPIMTNENFDLIVLPNSSTINSTSLNLIGTIPIKFNFNYDATSVKAISEKVFFVAAGSILWKTIDGGYNWELIKDFEFYIGSSMFFLNENQGWVEISDNSNSMVYYTSDGGVNFEKVFEKNFGNKSIIQIYFSSPTEGYLLTTKGEIYQTNDNSNFNLIYDFPDSDEGSGSTDFFNLSVFNNTLITSGTTGGSDAKPVLITKKDNIFNYSIFDNVIKNIQLIDESQAYLIKKTSGLEDKLFFTNITSLNLEETSSKRMHDFYFLNKNIGIGVSSSSNYGHHIIFETYDGGKNWKNKYKFKNFEYSLDIDFYNNIGLITGKRGRLWKHILE
ncbi:MAG: hypothetical protein COC08_04135 [Maribacter sp.]|nr:MAG: hypothetical protein COC08_04135 [Maribacter sp.]